VSNLIKGQQEQVVKDSEKEKFQFLIYLSLSLMGKEFLLSSFLLELVSVTKSSDKVAVVVSHWCLICLM